MAGTQAHRAPPRAAGHERPGRPRSAAGARPALPHPDRQADRTLQADRLPAAGPAGSGRSGRRHRHQRGPARAQRPAVRGQRGAPRTSPGSTSPPAHPRRRRRHHRRGPSGEFAPADPGQARRTAWSGRSPRRWTGPSKAAGLTRADLHRLVIGTPGAFDPGTGRLRYASHLPGWHSPTLLDELAAALPMPVEYENDVNLVAVAEQRLGAARGPRRLRPAVERGGTRRRPRHQRPAAPRLHRRRRRGRLPAGAGHPPRPAGHQGQQRRLPGAGRRPGGPPARPRTGRRARPDGPYAEVAAELRRPGRPTVERRASPRCCDTYATGSPPVSPRSSPSSTPS